eukprot:gene22286-23397_t
MPTQTLLTGYREASVNACSPINHGCDGWDDRRNYRFARGYLHVSDLGYDQRGNGRKVWRKCKVQFPARDRMVLSGCEVAGTEEWYWVKPHQSGEFSTMGMIAISDDVMRDLERLAAANEVSVEKQAETFLRVAIGQAAPHEDVLARWDRIAAMTPKQGILQDMIIVDASVAVKWAFPEPGRDDALKVLKLGHLLSAPDLIHAEVANVFRKRMKRGEMTPDQADEAIRVLTASFQTLVPSKTLAANALRYAQQLDHSAYDCFYLAATDPMSYLVTADDVFVRKCVVADVLSGATVMTHMISGMHNLPIAQDIQSLTSAQAKVLDVGSASANLPDKFDARALNPRFTGDRR